MSAALRKLLASLSQADRDAALSNRWGDGDRLAARCGIDFGELRALLSDTRPQAPADRFKWLAAIAGCRALSERGLRVAIVLFQHMGSTGYVWPSQKAIARAAGIDERHVRRELHHLHRIGAIRRLRGVDAPREVTSVILRPAKEGGSGRTARANCYAVIAPDDWCGVSDTGPNWPSNNRADLALHNYKMEPKGASHQDSIISSGSSSETSPPSSTVGVTLDGMVQDEFCCAEPRAREANHG
ncbi:helix-turn-helix domain-containing protein [Ancylobacter terrae]|uniref:helix-turn-helix domain-containing protein n=1 Tax=Ancylobacter sp. sgz301288 TaxID=3342077 RepID=UPI003859E248